MPWPAKGKSKILRLIIQDFTLNNQEEERRQMLSYKVCFVSPWLSGITDRAGQAHQRCPACPAQNHGEIHVHLQVDPVLQLHVEGDPPIRSRCLAVRVPAPSIEDVSQVQLLRTVHFDSVCASLSCLVFVKPWWNVSVIHEQLRP